MKTILKEYKEGKESGKEEHKREETNRKQVI